MTVRDRLSAIVDALPAGASVTLPVDTLRGWLADEPGDLAPAPVQVVPDAGWRTRLWSCPADTRLGVRDLAEALDRSPDWVYRAVNRDRADKRGRDPLPCKRLDGVLVFTAGELRAWLRSSESLVNPARNRNGR